MRNNEKLDVLEAGDALDINAHARTAATTPVTPLTARAPYGLTRRTAPQAAPAAPAPRMHYALLLGLTWLCGPAALLLTPAGRRHRLWLGLGLAATVAGLVMLVVPYARFVTWTGLATPLAWGALAALATIGGFSAWARAVLLVGAHVPPPHRQPRMLRSRPAICALGLLAPGAGMLASGGRWRAALWLWALWPAALGLIVLRNALDMWRHLSTTVPDRAAADLLEGSILLAAIAVVLGGLAWLVQALEGARRLAPVPALGRGRGDWFALALGVSCAALAVAGNPQRAARQLGDAALVLQAEGLRLVPLQLTLAADRLDPSRAEYAVTAIALHEARGDSERAAALRLRLDDGLASYVALRERPADLPDAGAPAVLRPGALAPAGEGDLYYGTMARTGRPAARR